MSTPAKPKPCTICKDPSKELHNDSSLCSDCKKNKAKELYEKNKLIAQEKLLSLDLSSTQKCTKCNNDKILTDFYMAKQKGIVRSICKICTNEAKKEYYENNKEKYNKQITEYQKQKTSEDKSFKFKQQLKNKISYEFKSLYIKGGKPFDYLDCTCNFLNEWLIYQFVDDMTIENFGTVWNIIRVNKSYDLLASDQVKEYFCWKNLKPVNIKEINKEISAKIIKDHSKLVNKYLKSLNNQTKNIEI